MGYALFAPFGLSTTLSFCTNLWLAQPKFVDNGPRKIYCTTIVTCKPLFGNMFASFLDEDMADQDVQFESLLHHLLSPDNNSRQQAEVRAAFFYLYMQELVYL